MFAESESRPSSRIQPATVEQNKPSAGRGEDDDLFGFGEPELETEKWKPTPVSQPIRSTTRAKRKGGEDDEDLFGFGEPELEKSTPVPANLPSRSSSVKRKAGEDDEDDLFGFGESQIFSKKAKDGRSKTSKQSEDFLGVEPVKEEPTSNQSSRNRGGSRSNTSLAAKPSGWGVLTELNGSTQSMIDSTAVSRATVNNNTDGFLSKVRTSS